VQRDLRTLKHPHPVSLHSHRRSFLLSTGSSAAFTSCSWKTCFNVSMPIRIIWSTDGFLCLSFSQPHSGTAMPEGGCPPQHLLYKLAQLASPSRTNGSARYCAPKCVAPRT
jgi:hypothetical protein